MTTLRQLFVHCNNDSVNVNHSCMTNFLEIRLIQFSVNSYFHAVHLRICDVDVGVQGDLTYLSNQETVLNNINKANKGCNEAI